MVVTNYKINGEQNEGQNISRDPNIRREQNQRGEQNIRIALVADLHDCEYTNIISEIRCASPDMIAIAGDLMNVNESGVAVLNEQKHALGFLSEAVKIAPTFYSLGNNERLLGGAAEWDIVKKKGACVLDNSYVNLNNMWIGGLSSACARFSSNGQLGRFQPDANWVKEFDALSGYKILLCHHPEYYPKYLISTSINLILSGHAHGGQWRVFGRGLYAPGQGFFPKLTSGVHDGRLVISRGLSNTKKIPRFNNPIELVIVDVC